MPIYEFRCSHCGHRFEVLCGFNETGDALQCPECGGTGAGRLMSVFMARGLENGHHGLGKTWGSAGSGKSESTGDSGSKSEASSKSESSSKSEPAKAAGS